MNNLAYKITVGIAGLISVVGVIMMIMILITGGDVIENGGAEGLKNSFIYLVIAALVISVIYFVATGILSLVTNPSALKKDALPLIVLVVIGVLLFWVAGLDTEVLAKASFINETDTKLTEYYGLSQDQLSAVSSWRSWLMVSVTIITGSLLGFAVLFLVYDLVKSIFK